jgi:hypothetical protein
MKILIDAVPDDTSAMLVRQRLVERGVHVDCIETTKFPSTIQISYDPGHLETAKLYLSQEAEPLALADVKGIYRRGSKWIGSVQDNDWLSADLVYWNIESALGSLYRLLPCKWVNPIAASNEHKHKSYQLAQLQQAGIRIPKTLVSNKKEDLECFMEALNGEVIVKFPQGGATTQVFGAHFFNPHWLKLLEQTPVKLQEKIEGIDIRAYVIEEMVFALEIHAEQIDFRESPLAYRKAITLPPEIEAQCRQVKHLFGLNFVAIDMKRNASGEHVFFEGNPTPIFLYDEVATGYPISESIAAYLLSD